MQGGSQPQPTVSVVVSVFNTARYLRECLESLRLQTLREIEIICVNDGSTDESSAIMRELAEGDRRIRVLDKPNSGYGDSMNCGIALARAPYIGIVEPDDWADPNMFARLAEAAQRHGDPDIVKAGYTRVVDADTPQQRFLPWAYRGRVAKVDEPFTIDQDAEILFHHPSIWTAIYRKAFLDREHIAFAAVPGAGWVDNPFLMETLAAAESIVYLDEPLYFYREFSGALAGGLRDPRVISERWVEMDEVLRRRGICAPKVLEAHYSRGCSYVQMLDEDFPGDLEAQKCAQDILARLDGPAIMRSTKILPEYQNAYLAHCSRPRRLQLQALRKLSR